MKVFAKIISMFVIALGLINIFGGVISGIWLSILGEWAMIGYGLLALIISGMGISLALIPGLLFVAPAAVMLEKGNKVIGYLLGFLGSLYTITVLVGWCVLVLVFCMRQTNNESIIPILIWSYGIATGPIIWMAQKELQGGNEYAMISTFFIQIAYLLTILGILFIGMSLLNVIVLFASIMLFGLIFQFSMAYLVEQPEDY